MRLAVRCQKVGERLHVVVQQDQQIPGGVANAGITGRCASAIGLPQGMQTKWSLKTGHHFAGAILRAVNGDDHLDLRRIDLLLEQGRQQALHRFTAAIGWDHNGDG